MSGVGVVPGEPRLQRPNLYNAHMPGLPGQDQAEHHPDQHAQKLKSWIQTDLCTLFGGNSSYTGREFHMRLSEVIGLMEEFHVLYGLGWTKEEHIKLIRTLYHFIITPNMNPTILERIFKIYSHLLKKKYLVKRSELELAWLPLFEVYYHWEDSSDANRDLIKCSPEFRAGLKEAIRNSRAYFPESATEEMLKRWRPMLCPFDRSISTAFKYFNLFLPTSSYLPPEKSHGLWLKDIMQLWSSSSNHPTWESDLLQLLSRLAMHQRGRLDWEPYVERMFVCIMTSLGMPVTYADSGVRIDSTKGITHYVTAARWIVSAIEGGRGLIQRFLTRLFGASQSYFQPANYNSSSEALHAFISCLCYAFVSRVHIERYNEKYECRTPPEKRLTDDDITNFVQSLKPIAFHILFNPHDEERRNVIDSLATLRPHLILPDLMDKTRLAAESLTEPHRFTACLSTLAGCSRTLVENYPEYVIEIMDILLPGINVNDIWKCTDIFVLLSDFLEMIWPVDFSSPEARAKDQAPTEAEQALLSKTSMFEDYVAQFTDKCLTLVEISSREQTRTDTDVHEDTLNDEELAIDCSVAEVFQRIIAKSSPKVFNATFDKLKRYVTTKILDPTVAAYILASMLKGLVAVNPEPVLDYFLPHLCHRVDSALEYRGDSKAVDPELQFALVLLSEIVSIRSTAIIFHGGSYLIKYLDQICHVLDKTLTLSQKEEYELASTLLQNVLHNLVHIRPLNERTSYEVTEWNRDTFQWAKASHPSQIKFKWYVPGKEELKCVQTLVDRYLGHAYTQLELHVSGQLEMDKDERLRNIRQMYKIIYGISELLEALHNDEDSPYPGERPAFDGIPWINQLKISFRGRPVREEARKLVHDLQRYLLTTCPDDVDSLLSVVTLIDTLLLSCGLDEDDLTLHLDEYKSVKAHRLNKVVRSKRHLPSVIRERVMLQLEIHLWLRSMLSLRTLPNLVLHDLVDLCISHYSDVRSNAQALLAKALSRTDSIGYHKILPKILECLSPEENVSHQMLKGALYMIIGDKSIFCYDWKLASQLYPALIVAQHSDRNSIMDLFKDFSTRSNRVYSDCSLFTLPVIEPVIPAALKEMYSTNNMEIVVHSGDSNMDVDDAHALEGVQQQQSVDPDYLRLEQTLCELINSERLHWRHTQMAMGLLITILHPSHKPSDATIDLWTRCLVHDDRQIRSWAFQALEIILRMFKPRKGKRNKVVVPAPKIEGQFIPGPRAENECMQYRPMEQDELKGYYQQPFTPKAHLGYSTYPEPYVLRIADKPGDEDKPENQVEARVKNIILKYFTDETFLKKFFQLNSMEHRKGEDAFSMDKGLFYKVLFEQFGRELLPVFYAELPGLVTSDQESKQRSGAEIIFGLVRGSRFWSYDRAMEINNYMAELIRTILDNVTVDSEKDWETCFGCISNKHDANRLQWLYETLLDPTLFEGRGSFRESMCIRFLDKTLQLNWKARNALVRGYKLIINKLDHPYNKVRALTSKILGTIVVMDVQHIDHTGNPIELNTVSKFPSRKDILDVVIPKLTLNVHNPELNGFLNNATGEQPMLLDDNNSANSSEGVSIDADVCSDNDERLNNDQDGSDGNEKEEDRLLQGVASWLFSDIHSTSTTITAEVYRLLPFLCQYTGNETSKEASQYCLHALCFISVCIVPQRCIPAVLDMVSKVAASPSYKAKMTVLEFVLVFTFTNFMSLCMNKTIVQTIKDIIVTLMADENILVRTKSSRILSGFAHSEFLREQEQLELIQVFRKRIRTRMLRKNTANSKTVFQKAAMTKENLAFFHSGILGLCAIVEAYPYDVPSFVPEILMELEGHLHDPQPIPRTIKKALQEFKRTHLDNWDEHKQKFTEDQLVVMTDLLVSPNYYA